MATKKSTKKAAETPALPTHLIFNIEDEENKTYEELLDIYQKQIDDYKAYLETITDVDVIKADEPHIIKLQDEWNEICHKRVYPIKPKMTWHEMEITSKQIGAKINAILEKYEVEYSATLGMYQISRYWANPGKEITFDCMNSTAKILGETGIKYKGPREWENILIINEYFKDNNETYRRDNLKMIFYGCIHSTMVDRLQLVSPIPAQGTLEGVAETQAPVEGPIEMVEA